MLSLWYFLYTVHGFLPFASRVHASHLDVKDAPPPLSVFKFFHSVLLLCGSFLAAGLFGNLISDKANLRCVLFFLIYNYSFSLWSKCQLLQN